MPLAQVAEEHFVFNGVPLAAVAVKRQSELPAQFLRLEQVELADSGQHTVDVARFYQLLQLGHVGRADECMLVGHKFGRRLFGFKIIGHNRVCPVCTGVMDDFDRTHIGTQH